MLYEMVTGARAFAGTSTADTLSAVIRAQPKAPSAIVPRSPQRPREGDPAVPAEGSAATLPAHRRREDCAAGHQGGIGLGRRSVCASRAHASSRPDRGTGGHRDAWCRQPRRGCCDHIAQRQSRHCTSCRSRRCKGEERHPTFSPDGEQVAFAWNGPKQDNWDIYVTLVGSSNVRRLTSDPAPDTQPAWSPDGRQIAFLRERPDGSTIQLVSALGGEDRKLSDFRGADSIGWSPDGQWLVAGRSGENGAAGQPRGIYLIPVEGGEARPLIASSPVVADYDPAFAPDGRRLAYASCGRASTGGLAGFCDIYVVELNAAHTPSMPPRRLTTQRSLFIESLTWTRDGSAVVYAAATPEHESLARRGCRDPLARAH